MRYHFAPLHPDYWKTGERKGEVAVKCHQSKRSIRFGFDWEYIFSATCPRCAKVNIVSGKSGEYFYEQTCPHLERFDILWRGAYMYFKEERSEKNEALGL